MNDSCAKTVSWKEGGFTLVEVLVASMIGAFIALVAVGTLKTISVSAEMTDDNIETAAGVRFACKRIAGDLMNLYRDTNQKDTRFIGTVEETEFGGVSRVIFYTVGRTKARIAQPEGDVYEVEYFLLNDEDKSVLCRRLWPNPDKEAQPGGIITVIAENIAVFEARYFDGQQWQVEWPEEMESIPEIVQLNIGAVFSKQRYMLVESVVVNLARSAGGQIGSLEDIDQEESGGESETNESDEGE